MSKVRSITLDEMLADLKAGEVTLSFTKASGEPRHMIATLKDDLIPATENKGDGESRLQKQREGGKLTALPVWEMTVGWRSFRLDSVDDWNGEQVKYAGS